VAVANPGLGYRQVYSVLMEMSRHLLQPLVSATLLSAVTPGEQTVGVSNTQWMFEGAGLIVEPGTSNAELILPDTIVPSTSISALFANSHAANSLVLGATFPIQADTDPLFTPSEMLSYISRAQNDFLARVPSYYVLANATIKAGQLIQTTDCTPIQMVRVAASTRSTSITSLTRTSGLVVAVTQSPHNLSAGSKFSILNPVGDSTFAGGAFSVIAILSPTSFNYYQGGADSSASGGTVGLLLRLYEVTQESLSQLYPNWQNHSINSPQSWFEDRVAVYQWGVNGIPASNFPAQLLYSIRDVDLLGQMDGFLVSDVCLHGVKYLALAYALEKDGEMKNIPMAQFYRLRFDRTVMAVQRWLDQVMNAPLSMTNQRVTQSRARAGVRA
jgi:hypothetical protein